jgi:hypothetical protein
MTMKEREYAYMLRRAEKHLDWLIHTIDFNNQQTGLDAEDSPELKDAKEVHSMIQKEMENADI